MNTPKVRLYVDQPLGQGQAIALIEGAANYLFAVMRLSAGDMIHVFNGKDGEWRARVTESNKRRGIALCEEQTRVQTAPPDLWLLFTPIKKERTAFIVEKAVELGVAKLQPVSTRRMNSERLRIDKQQAHAIEAAEQCEATYVPQVAELTPLDKLLADWPEDRALYWCDETRVGENGGWCGQKGEKAAILIGPEGGFHPDEAAKLASLPFVRPIALGPRILRAETAALAAVTLWQMHYGDWA